MKTGRALKIASLVLSLVLAAGLCNLQSSQTNVSAESAYNIKIVSSTTHSAAVLRGSLFVWGSNAMGQIPNSPDIAHSAAPIEVSLNALDVAVGPNLTYVLYKDYKLTAYGLDPVTKSKNNGKNLATQVLQVSAVGDFAVLLKRDGTVWTVGKNDQGQLGDGSTDGLEYPVKTSLTGIKKVAAGYDFTLALSEDGTLYGWGNNSSYQLGLTDPNTGEPAADTMTPKVIAQNVKDIAAGHAHSLVLMDDNTLFTCGDNTYGQLGIGEYTASKSLTKIMNRVSSFIAGSNHNFAIGPAGQCYYWGNGLQGQLGNGKGDSYPAPTVTNDSYVQYFAGYNTSFGIDANGYVWSWGESSLFRTAKNDGANASLPARVFSSEMNWIYNMVGANTNPYKASGYDGISNTFIGGYPGGTFLPERTVKRGEFLKMAVLALCSYDPDYTYGFNPFPDLYGWEWYADYIIYAYAKGFINGDENGNFRPEDPITRAEACKIVSNMLNISGKKSAFTDLPSSHWAYPSVSALAEKGYLTGYTDGSFRPQKYITRGETAKIISLVSGFSPVKEDIPGLVYSVENPFHDLKLGDWYVVYILRGAGLIK